MNTRNQFQLPLLLRPFETDCLVTEVFHNMIGNKRHRLDQDVRRLRLRFLPKHTFGKVVVFSRVHSDSSSIRGCTAKGEGVVIMWQPVKKDHYTALPGGLRDTEAIQ